MLTCVEIVVVPEVPITVNVEVPIGVPVYVELVLLLAPLPAQPTSTPARVTISRQIPKAKRRLGLRRDWIMPAANSAASTAENPSVPHGQGFRFDGGGGNFELEVVSVRRTGVPARTGVTGFGLKAQVDFAGFPTQLNAKVRFDPVAS